MNAETIKDFLVSLGFKVDESGERKFNAVLAGLHLTPLKPGSPLKRRHSLLSPLRQK